MPCIQGLIDYQTAHGNTPTDEGLLSRPFPSRPHFSGPQIRVNGKIRAREVRVIGPDAQQLGVIPLADALNLARQHGVDLVEIAPNATPPVCRLVDFGKYRYEQAKREKDSRKHQHANKVKEVQLRPSIDPHDFAVKRDHAIDFLCDEMKVKISLRFRGREMAHKEYGFQQVQKLITELAPYGHPDQPPKLIGKGITTMLTPLPRNQRAKHPKGKAQSDPNAPDSAEDAEKDPEHDSTLPKRVKGPKAPKPASSENPTPDSGFSNSAFSDLETPPTDSGQNP